MRYLPDLGSIPADGPPSDPSHYVRQADLALLYGSREQAVALIELAYVAYDLLYARCEAIIGCDRAWPGKNS